MPSTRAFAADRRGNTPPSIGLGHEAVDDVETDRGQAGGTSTTKLAGAGSRDQDGARTDHDAKWASRCSLGATRRRKCRDSAQIERPVDHPHNRRSGTAPRRRRCLASDSPADASSGSGVSGQSADGRGEGRPLGQSKGPPILDCAATMLSLPTDSAHRLRHEGPGMGFPDD